MMICQSSLDPPAMICFFNSIYVIQRNNNHKFNDKYQNKLKSKIWIYNKENIQSKLIKECYFATLPYI